MIHRLEAINARALKDNNLQNSQHRKITWLLEKKESGKQTWTFRSLNTTWVEYRSNLNSNLHRELFMIDNNFNFGAQSLRKRIQAHSLNNK